MQFAPDFEMCIRNPMKVRTLKEPRRSEIINDIRQCRLMKYQMQAYYLDDTNIKEKAIKWLKRRGYEN